MPNAPSPTAMLVRIKPYNPRKGYVLRTWVDGITGAVFKEERGWYEVDDAALVERLKNVRSRPEREESPEGFDVCTREEAIDLERRIRRAMQSRHAAVDPLSVEGASRDHLGGKTPRFPAARDTNTLTTADLPGNQRSTRAAAEDDGDESDLDSDDLAASVETDIGRKTAPAGTATAPRRAAAPKKASAAKAGSKPPTPPGAPVPGAPTGGVLPAGDDA